MQNDFLDTAIEFVKGVGPARAELLKKELGVFSIADMLNHFPFRFEDRRSITKIEKVKQTETYIQLIGKIQDFADEGVGKGKRLKAWLYDDTGTIELVWFQGAQWVKKKLNREQVFFVCGKAQEFRGFYNLPHPEIEVFDPETIKKEQRIKPIYALTELIKKRGLDSKALSQITFAIVHDPRFSIEEYLSASILTENNLIPNKEAYIKIHSPSSLDDVNHALRRLKFNELLDLQMKIVQRKTQHKLEVKGVVLDEIATKFNTFYSEHLPFPLTEAQKRVLREIRMDVKTGKQMNRLLQGDVGSGKTMVAWFTMLMAIDNGYQACLMAPTEILAQQHAETITEYAALVGLKVALHTGSTKTKQKRTVLADLEAGNIDIIIGTHALIEDTVNFKNLGMVVIDEQHRFGVEQRAKLWAKYKLPPHVLVMTATPIPRTLAMTVYGDLDVSVIDEMPPGRIPTKTVHKFKKHFTEVALFAEEQIKQGKQVYIVYPLIHESDKLDYQDLMSAYDDVVRYFPLPKYHISLMHGKLKPAEKEAEMQRFKEGKTQIMMATTVIEVGVNVPNATVMIIENAERFGLSQLHQLRGRVGRSSAQAYCILISGNKLSKTARQRLQAMEKTTDGFEIAALDMKLRGPGEIDGTKQSGLLDLKLSDIAKDDQLLYQCRAVAEKLLKEDPKLELPVNRALKLHLQQQSKGKVWRRIS